MVFFKHILVILMFFPFVVKSQDTTFVKSLKIPFFADNVTSDGNVLFIRSADSIYGWKNSKLEFVSEAKLKYSWYNSSNGRPVFTHTKDIPKLFGVNPNIQHLIPGLYNGKITSTRIDDELYLSYNGVVLQYEIQSNIQRFLRGVSVRHIFSETSGIRVISTYSGVFVDLKQNKITDSTFNNPIVQYSSGSFTEIDNRYFLCQDDLLEFDYESQKMIRQIITDGQPRFRQLFKFNGSVYSLMTKGVNILNIDSFEFEQSLLRNEEITSYEIMDSIVVLGSRTNGIYTIDTSSNLTRLNAPKNINDIIIYNKNLLLCTDNGLYSLNLETGDYKQLTTEKYLHTIVKYKNGVIYSGDRGLYWFSGNQSTSIVKGVEFNKLALTINSNNLYAGSINGLYRISVSDLQLLTNESSNKPINKSDSEVKNEFNFYWILVLFSILILGVFGYLHLQKQYNKKTQQKSREKITLSTVKLSIYQNESIKSVEDIARHFNTSVSQVNRRLKLQDATPLKCLKETKREIVTQMHQDGKSIEEMVKRVGYSKRYIREKFLS